MRDERVSKMADIMTRYSIEVKKGDFVVIQSDMSGAALIKEVYKSCLQAGANPFVICGISELDEIRYRYANDDQLTFISPPYLEALKSADALIQIVAESNTHALTSVSGEKMRIRAAGMQEANRIFMERLSKGDMRWSATLFPTNATAQEAGMSLTEYEDFVFDACGVNDSDPVCKWRQIKEEQDKICSILGGKKVIRIVSKDTDLSMSINERSWENCCGHENFPDGEVFTSPVEDSIEGTIRFTFPGIYNGREIEDIRLRFENGKVVKACSAKGEELLLELLDTDEGSRYIGEFGIGTNNGIRRFTKHMLFDEKIGGTVHLALGMGFPQCCGRNVSNIHWDMLCDMRKDGKIYADGELIYKDGRFLF